LRRRLTLTDPEAPLEGIRRGGWKLVYGDKATDLMKEIDGENKSIDATASLGVMFKEDGTVSDVVPGKVAHKAGIGPGMKVLAVNTRRWSDKVLRAALAASKKTGKIDLILEHGEVFQSLSLAYQDGERYPRLERDQDVSDLIGAITQPITP
jgi:predicted metalloprotease with PDZ domain